MNKEQIEDIIKDLEKREYEVRFKTYEDNIVGFYCNEHAFTIDTVGKYTNIASVFLVL